MCGGHNKVALNISVNPGFSGPGESGYQPLDKVTAYMGENLHFFDLQLTPADMAAIGALA